MLEIVKKRAALRPSDTMVGSDGGGGYDVSGGGEGGSTSTPSTLHPSLSPSLVSVDNNWHAKRTEALKMEKDRRVLFLKSGATLGASCAIIVLIVAFVYPALVIDCLGD